ncbi:MAG: histidine phosphatase family protein, partial [Oscillospiraceae bacterium]|nr:histidine phosphatase family protein [Oscillospiraceae bacterium]
MRTYKIHLIRHGLTQGNFQAKYIGQKTDLPLCEEGIEGLK